MCFISLFWFWPWYRATKAIWKVWVYVHDSSCFHSVWIVFPIQFYLCLLGSNGRCLAETDTLLTAIDVRLSTQQININHNEQPTDFLCGYFSTGASSKLDFSSLKLYNRAFVSHAVCAACRQEEIWIWSFWLILGMNRRDVSRVDFINLVFDIWCFAEFSPLAFHIGFVDFVVGW